MYCELCREKMSKYPSSLPLYFNGKVMNINNYPFYICPRCASVRVKRKDMKKTVSFLRKQGGEVPFISDIGS